ncbi:N-acetylmuramoyl-L-alanine amidase family protein [Clostridium paridis]|uniref:N-acetylmuramoyl-L-alanine amidase family protein n=1 Tax=Clostridium paridis TaxID=2803863 RepID=A0A937FIB9_9CLOT|nr:N-acetylmuramoyl-L-alanine amidase family protein [Clostridium paridis]MBL4932632.1 N-acetylmuramoyl-L-alanine amidase family protein [Clostridium paridis]
MKNLKKALGILILYIFILTVLPINVLAKKINAAESTVPKYLDYSEAYIMTGIQYKDKTLLDSEFGLKYYNNGTSSDVSDLSWYVQYSQNQVVDPSNELIFNLETGKVSNLEQDSTYVLEKNAVTTKYSNITIAYMDLIPIRSTGDVKWSRYKIRYVKNNVTNYIIGVVNSSSKVYEVKQSSTDYLGQDFNRLAYGSVVYNNSFYYLDANNNVNIIGADGIYHNYPLSTTLKSIGNAAYIYVNQNGIYLNYNTYVTNRYNYLLQKVKIENNQIIASGNPIINATYSVPILFFSLDVNNNIWYVNDGYVYKIENDVPVKKYQVDTRMNGVYVYDDYHLTVSGIDKSTYTGIYKIININSISGWKLINGKWYYYVNGSATTGWSKVSGVWYYMDTSGIMKTGWNKVSGVWYYMDASGAMKTGWNKVSGAWYYMDATGAMKTGWNKVSGVWYYMDASGAMKTGWILVSGNWYYLYSNGQMAYNTTIGGCKLGANGAWIK